MVHYNMPKYQSHKEVWAAEISKIEIDAATVTISFKDCDPIKFMYVEYAKMVHRYRPAEGDFLVIYPDGYNSFSPAKAFLEGYERL